MKGKMQSISHAVNDALIEVALILATGLFRMQMRTSLLPENSGVSETGLDFPPEQSVHSMRLGARGAKL